MKKKIDLSEYLSILSKEAADELEENIKKLREKHRISHAKRLKRIAKELNSIDS